MKGNIKIERAWKTIHAAYPNIGKTEFMKWIQENRSFVAKSSASVIAYHFSLMISKQNPGSGRGFYFFGRFKSKLAARRQEKRKAGSFIREKGGYYYVLKPRKLNPPERKKVVRIYGRVIRVIAKKTGPHKNCDAECKRCHHEYFHDFKAGAVMCGLPDGSILIKKG